MELADEILFRLSNSLERMVILIEVKYFYPPSSALAWNLTGGILKIA